MKAQNSAMTWPGFVGQADAATFGDDDNGAGKPEDHAGNVVQPELFPGQEGGEDDDQQRPQVGDQTDLNGRGRLDREEIGTVIDAKAGGSQRPYLPWLPQRPDRARAKDPARHTDEPA